MLEALNAEAQTLVVVPRSGTTRERLRGFLQETFSSAARQPATAEALRALMAASRLDPAFRDAFDAGFLARRRELLH